MLAAGRRQQSVQGLNINQLLIFGQPGPAGILDCYDSDSNVSGGSGLSDSDRDSEVLSKWSGSKRQKISGCDSEPISP